MRRGGGGLRVGEASCEVERDEKEVDGVGHAEGDEVDELKVCYVIVKYNDKHGLQATYNFNFGLEIILNNN